MKVIPLKQGQARLHSTLEERARLRFIERDFTRALRDAQKAVQHGPSCYQAQVLLGDVLCGLGRMNEALACYHRARVLAPHEADPCWSIGTLHFLAGRFRQALCYLDLAKGRLKRGDGPLYEWVAEDRAVVLLRLGRNDEALDAIRWGLKRRPHGARLRALRSEILATGRRRLNPIP